MIFMLIINNSRHKRKKVRNTEWCVSIFTKFYLPHIPPAKLQGVSVHPQKTPDMLTMCTVYYVSMTWLALHATLQGVYHQTSRHMVITTHRKIITYGYGHCGHARLYPRKCTQ